MHMQNRSTRARGKFMTSGLGRPARVLNFPQARVRVHANLNQEESSIHRQSHAYVSIRETIASCAWSNRDRNPMNGVSVLSLTQDSNYCLRRCPLHIDPWRRERNFKRIHTTPWSCPGQKQALIVASIRGSLDNRSVIRGASVQPQRTQTCGYAGTDLEVCS